MKTLTELFEKHLTGKEFPYPNAMAEYFWEFFQKYQKYFPENYNLATLTDYFEFKGWLYKTFEGKYKTLDTFKDAEGLIEELPARGMPENDVVICTSLRAHVINTTTMGRIASVQPDPGYALTQIIKLTAEIIKRGGKISVDENETQFGHNARRYQIILKDLYIEWYTSKD